MYRSNGQRLTESFVPAAITTNGEGSLSIWLLSAMVVSHFVMTGVMSTAGTSRLLRAHSKSRFVSLRRCPFFAKSACLLRFEVGRNPVMLRRNLAHQNPCSPHARSKE